VEKVLGYKPEEIVGKKHFYDLFHPEEREELKKVAFQAFAKKSPIRDLVNRNIHKNGNPVWLSTSGVPIVDKKGSLLGYRGADTDITERKKMEDELKQERGMLEAVTENIGPDTRHKEDTQDTQDL
jgi:PAS domain S-box-containing protein